MAGALQFLDCGVGWITQLNGQGGRGERDKRIETNRREERAQIVLQSSVPEAVSWVQCDWFSVIGAVSLVCSVSHFE